MRRAVATLLLVLLATACGPGGDGLPVPSDTRSTPTVSATFQPEDTVTAGPATSTSPTGDPGTAEVARLTCWQATPPAGDGEVVFADVTESLGLVEPLLGVKGHAAAWGDVNGDLRPDLAFGTFANRPVEDYRVRGATGPAPDRLLVSAGDTVVLDDTFPESFGRTSGAAFADLDGDGDQDLVLARFPREGERATLPTQLYENVAGSLVMATATGLPAALRARSVGVLDYDGDGLLDLFLLADPIGGDSSVLLRNQGGLVFEDVTSAAGIPLDFAGLGVAVADLNRDALSDIVVGGTGRILLGGAGGEFRAVADSVLDWAPAHDEDLVAGVAIADLNRDLLPDIVVGHHFNSTAQGNMVPIQILLQTESARGDVPQFRDISAAAGMPEFATKAPHVELVDFDNDGWVDILATASAENGSLPTVMRNRGVAGGIPQFDVPPGLGADHYWVTAPTVDFDRDGRMDIFLVEWEQSLPSRLLRNETSGGNWIEVSIGASAGPGVGAKVTVWGSGGGLLGMREITISAGYAAGGEPFAHFGLGDADTVDIEIDLGSSAGAVSLRDMPANRHVRWPAGC